MNKKLLLIGAGFTLGSALLVTSAFAGVGDAPGYDAYKSAVKSTMSVQSMAENVELTVQDNGKTVLNVSSNSKTDKSNRTASADITVQGGSNVSVYRQDGKQIVKSSGSDVYTVYGGNTNKQWDGQKKHAGKSEDSFNPEVENVVDALVGNLKNYVTSATLADGSKQIDVQLSGSQIPTAANAIGSLLIKHASSIDHAGKAPNAPAGIDLKQIHSSLPKLTQDIQISEADLQAVVDSQDRISKQTVKLTITGKDAQGASHEVVVNADIGLSGFNSTTPDKVDLTGKQVQTVQNQRFHHGE